MVFLTIFFIGRSFKIMKVWRFEWLNYLDGSDVMYANEYT